ncbi:MAG: CBS domain-containing protein [Chromatiales bacterium]|nr:CBS domain-containing protein [Chromatiales bacterium]
MHPVGAILAQKGRQIWSVAPGDSMLQAITLMAERGIGALLVMEGAELLGVISERDYARKIILQGRRSAETAVGDVMSRDVVTVSPEATAEQGLQLMTKHFIRHLPVIEEGQVVGVVSIGDLVKAVIEDQQFVIQELERYVSG